MGKKKPKTEKVPKDVKKVTHHQTVSQDSHDHLKRRVAKLEKAWQHYIDTGQALPPE